MFRENDIEDSLFYSRGGQYGAYDNLQWSVLPGTDHTELSARVLSFHEYLHHSLNRITSYGVILFGFAFAAKQESQKEDFYSDVLHALIEKCRFAHEAYATWYGITLFKKNAGEKLEDELLANEEYRDYYDRAARLARNIPGLYLQKWVVSTAIRFCFQSRMIANYATENAQTFDLRAIPEAEFPNSRFEYITTQLPEDFFINMLTEYAGSLEGQDKVLMQAALNGSEGLEAFLIPDKDHLSAGIIAKINSSLQHHFDAFGSPSLDIESEHMRFLNNEYELQSRLLPGVAGDLIFPQDAGDAEHTILLSFENETLLLANRPPQCVIFDSTQFNEEQKKEILEGTGNPPHIFIMGRTALFMQNQYRFQYEENREWFSSLQGPFTAIRFADDVDGRRVVVMIPFEDPGQTAAFLKDKDPAIPVLGCVAMSAAQNSQWWQTWRHFFFVHSTLTCILMDVSPIDYLEQGFGASMVFYASISVETPGANYAGVLIQLKETNGEKAVILVPGSIAYCHMLEYYMQKKYPQYTNDISLSETEQYAIDILMHIVKEEYAWNYNAQNQNNTAAPENNNP